MSFGSGADQGTRPPTGGFDFGLVPSGRQNPVEGAPAPRRNRRRSGPDRNLLVRTLVIVGLSAAVIGGAALFAHSRVQAAEAEVKADSAAFCADIAGTPGVLTQAGFGWPTEVADLPTTIASMKAYQERWTNLAKSGPPTIREDLAAVATAAGTVITSVEATQSINRQGNLAAIDAVTSQTVLRAWAAKYCD
jgi:hypothetical protein